MSIYNKRTGVKIVRVIVFEVDHCLHSLVTPFQREGARFQNWGSLKNIVGLGKAKGGTFHGSKGKPIFCSEK